MKNVTVNNMKRIFLLVGFLFFAICSFSQYIINQSIGSGNTRVFVPPNGAFQASLINRTFTDTTAANLTPIDFYAGAQIYTTSDNRLWIRNSSATAWEQVAFGSGINLYNSDGMLTGHRLLTGNNNTYGLILDSLAEFEVRADVGVQYSHLALGQFLAHMSYTGNPYTSELTATNGDVSMGIIGGNEISVSFDSIRKAGPGIGLANDTTNRKIQTINPITGAESYSNWIGSSTPIDTSLFVHKADSSTVSNPIGYVKGRAFMGVTVNGTFPGPSIQSGFTEQAGAATISYNNGISISGGTANTYTNNFVKSTYFSQSNNYQYQMDFTVGTKPTNHEQGLILGKFATINMWAQFKYGGTGGGVDSAKVVLRLSNGPGGGTAYDSTANISLVTSGVYQVKLTQSSNSIYMRVSKFVGGLETEVKEKMFVIINGQFYQLPSIGVIGVQVLGGAYTNITLKQTNYDYQAADVLIHGTSIVQAYSPSTIVNHWVLKLFEHTTLSFINYGSAGTSFSTIMPGLPELFAAQPRVIGVEFGVNDAAATLRASANAYFDSLAAHGYTGPNGNVFWIKDFTDPAKDSIMYNIARERGIQLVDPGILMTSSDYIDGIHPTDQGSSFMAQFIKDALPQFFGGSGRTDQYTLQGLKDVGLNPIGIPNTDMLQYNSTLKKWQNVTIASLGTNWIQNQQASAQGANGWINGNFSANSNLSVGGQATGSFRLEVQENTTNGTGMYITNQNSLSGATKALQVVLKGQSAAEGSNWNNAGALEAVPNGGLILSSYATTGIQFLIGTRTARGLWNTTGLRIGNSTVPTAKLHIAAGTATASTAPQKFTAGTLLTTIEAFAKEANANGTYQTTNALNRFAEGGAIADFITTVGNSGTSETDLYTYTTKANTFAADGEKLSALYAGTATAVTTTARVLRVYFGGTVIAEHQLGSTGTGVADWQVTVEGIRASSSEVRFSVQFVETVNGTTTTFTDAGISTGLTLSGTNILKITGEVTGAGAGSDQLNAHLGYIKWFGAANN